MMRRRLLLISATLALSAVVLSARQGVPGNNPLAGNTSAVSEGQTLYNQTCQTCHGPAGQGSDRGPALNTGTFKHGNADADLFRAIRSGVPGTQMAPFGGLSDTQTWQLVSYLRSLHGSAPAAAAPSSGNAGAGEALFFGRAGCAGCHEVNARGGVVGPDLSNAGRLPHAVLQQKITDPNTPASAPAGGRGGRGGAAARDRPRENPGRQGDSRRAPERGYVFAPDDRHVRAAPDARQAEARVRRGSDHIAAPPGSRDAIVSCRRHGSRCLPSYAERPRHEQDRSRAIRSRAASPTSDC